MAIVRQRNGVVNVARVIVNSREENDGTRTVVVTLNALDAHDIPSVVSLLMLTPEEARSLAEQLLKKLEG